jgi:hypothetical protein
MIEELLKIVSKELGTELTLKIVFLHKRYGECLTVEQYSELFGIKPSTVFKQISDETVAIKPTKVGRNNLFSVIDVAKLFFK